MPLKNYLYRVRAVNGTGHSAWSNEAWADTTDPPGAPYSLQAGPASATGIDLSWSDGSTNERSFAVYRKSGASDWVRVAVLGPNVTVYADRGLAAGAAYTYRVRAFRNEGTSCWTNEVTARTLSLP
jgi:hypothetical protein